MSMQVVFLVFVASGLAGGLLLGLIGVGMALIAVPLLTLTLPYLGVPVEAAPVSALATSMALVSVGSFSSIYFHHRLGNVDWKLVRTIVPASLLGVALGSLGASHLPGDMLKLIFCVFLIIIAMLMLLPQRRSHAHQTTAAWQYRLVGGLIGIAGSLIGAGGGIFMVPFLNKRGHSMPKAVAVSTTIGLPVTVLGSLVYAVQPSPETTSTWMLGYIVLPAFLGLSLGSLVSAPIGAKLASNVPGDMLKKGFAILLLILALKMIV